MKTRTQFISTTQRPRSFRKGQSGDSVAISEQWEFLRVKEQNGWETTVTKEQQEGWKEW